MGECPLCGKKSELTSQGVCKECASKIYSEQKKQYGEQESSKAEFDNTTDNKDGSHNTKINEITQYSFKSNHQNIKKVATPYIILAVIALILFIVYWPVAVIYTLIAAGISAIRLRNKSKKATITLSVISGLCALTILSVFIGAQMPDHQLNNEDIQTTATNALYTHYNNLDLNPQIDNAQISDIGNNKYEVSGTMNSFKGGFIYRVSAVVEVSPDRTESRTVAIDLKQAN